MTELIDSKHVDMHCYFILRQYLPPHLHQGTHWVVSTSIPTFTSALVWFNLLRCKRGFCKIRLYLLSFETIVIFHLNIPMIHDNTELSMSNSYTNIYTYIRPSLPPSLNYLSMPPPIRPDKGVHFGFPVLNVGFFLICLIKILRSISKRWFFYCSFYSTLARVPKLMPTRAATNDYFSIDLSIDYFID